jgi:hypothetical protein
MLGASSRRAPARIWQLSVRKAFIAVGGLPSLASLLLEARCAYLPPLLFSAVCERRYAITPTVALKRPVSSRLAGAQLGLECGQVDRHKARDIATRAERRVFGTFREFRATHAKRHERSHEGDVHGNVHSAFRPVCPHIFVIYRFAGRDHGPRAQSASRARLRGSALRGVSVVSCHFVPLPRVILFRLIGKHPLLDPATTRSDVTRDHCCSCGSF